MARIAGLLHDLGKATDQFQRYLRGELGSGGDHKAAGSALARQLNPLPALAVLGHHGGIPDCAVASAILQEAMGDDGVNAVSGRLPEIVAQAQQSQVRRSVVRNVQPLESELATRMLFSALVDADSLDTEAFRDPEKAALRQVAPHPSDLWPVFEEHQRELLAGAEETCVNSRRREIYEHCLAAAEAEPGVFRLTVPTGGGKTLSGMAFALRHAMRYGHERVIVAMPYTSIIDQNAQVYRDIFGADNVLEHHSAVYERGEDIGREGQRQVLAADNWDIPIVVTTMVQFFESLFSNRPGQCRKVHNIANSVVVLDEVQTLPLGLLQPILDMLRGLVKHYRVTVVLSTATQPALSGESPYLRGFTPEPREIVPDPARYFLALKRVNYKILSAPCRWEEVAQEIRRYKQVLCVVNSRKDALSVLDCLDDPDAFHLSALLCPAHRRDLLVEIRQRLSPEQAAPCRVVATQVVEAGVDLDFPVVFRAGAPLDRVIQAAGRCNREGKRASGLVVVFTPREEGAPRGSYQLQTQVAWHKLEAGQDLNNPLTLTGYFEDVYRTVGRNALDSKSLTQKRKDGRFQQVAEEFRLIEEDTMPIVVPYRAAEVNELLAAISQRGFATRHDWRKLQQHSVSIYRRQHQEFVDGGLVKEVIPGLSLWLGPYGRTGISSQWDPADLMV